VDAAGGVREAALHPGRPHVPEDHGHLRPAPAQVLLRPDAAPRRLQVRRPDVDTVLQRRRASGDVISPILFIIHKFY